MKRIALAVLAAASAAWSQGINIGAGGAVNISGGGSGSGCGSPPCTLAQGGTGATTAAGALANLGGISSTATGTQNMAGGLDVAGSVSAGTTIILTPLPAGADNTAFINTAFISYPSVMLGPGFWPITCDAPTDITASSGGIRPPSGSTLTMSASTILECAPNTTGYYNAIALYNISNVNIYGGVLDGNRSHVTAPGTETGFGIECNGCSNVTIRDTVAQNFWGDGFYITNKSASQPTNVILDHVTANNSRRNGLSVESANGLIVSNSTFNNANGTLPEFGVDVEPGGGLGGVQNAQFINNVYSNNLVDGFGVSGYTGTDVSNLAVIGGEIFGNGSSMSTCGSGALYLYNNTLPILVDGVRISGNYCAGVLANGTTDAVLRNLIVVGNNTSGQTVSNLYSSAIASGTNTNLSVLGATVRNGSGYQQAGLVSIGDTGFYATGNDLAGSNVIGVSNDIYTFSSTSPIITCNRFTGATTNCSSLSTTGSITALLGAQLQANETGSNGGASSLAYAGSGSGAYANIASSDSSNYRAIYFNHAHSGHQAFIDSNGGGNFTNIYALLGTSFQAQENGSNGGVAALSYVGSGTGAYSLLSSGDTSFFRSIVLGSNVSNKIGYGGNTAPNNTLCGPSNLLCFDALGLTHQAGAVPVASVGTITGTNAGGYVSGLSTATTVTITFSGSGWSIWASCTASSSVVATQPYVSAQSKTAVTFSMASLTGTLYYHCDGN